MNIKETFLNLTSQTYPHGHESEVFHLLPKDLITDSYGNLFLQIGDTPSTMFTSHLDTASHDKTGVKHVIEGNIIKTDGNSILGADDKAGVTIMMYMIENRIPGLYYFFLGEERGCIGSKKVADSHKKNPITYIKKVVSFDRRGTNSIITYQSSQRCCSDNFANKLSESLNYESTNEVTIDSQLDYKKDPTGIYTDSYKFISIYPECTNISVGYQNEHTNRELQDIKHLEKLAKTCVLIDWENLPVERNPSIEELETEQNYGYGSDKYYQEVSDMWNYDYSSKKQQKKKIWFIDNEYENHISYVEVDERNRVITVDLHRLRIEDERKLINENFKDNQLEYQYIEWNGQSISIQYEDNTRGDYSRSEIEEFISELSFWTKYIK